MSDDTRIKVASALPRPTSEEHTRPLRLFARGAYTKPVIAAELAEVIDELEGERPYLSAHTYGRAIDVKRRP